MRARLVGAGSLLLLGILHTQGNAVAVPEGCVVTSPGSCSYRLTAPAAVIPNGSDWQLVVSQRHRGSTQVVSTTYGPSNNLPTRCRLFVPVNDVETTITATVAAAGTTLTVGDGADQALSDCPPWPGLATPPPASPAEPSTLSPLPDLPTGIPPAAQRSAPTLPVPGGWPASDEFPVTAGTGRLAHGAALWTSFVLDDHGARGTSQGTQNSTLAPNFGTYTYAQPNAYGNGADIFRSAVAQDSEASYWRVDWRTLVDPSVPLAIWAFDTDNSSATGVATWPGAAGVTSGGLDTALIVSSKGAELVDLVHGGTNQLPTTVSTNGSFPGSFVVRVPRSLLSVDGQWRIRLLAGVADATGTGLAPVAFAQGANNAQPPVYDVGYRSIDEEPATVDGTVAQANNWYDVAQAKALAAKDVTPFSTVLDWSALTAGATTPEARPLGVSERWYVSAAELGPGVVAVAQNKDPGNAVTYRGRIQPYTLVRPDASAEPHRFVILNHSLGDAFTQYSTQNPRLLAQLCTARHTVCVTPEGLGQDGKAIDNSELDLWQVWRATAETESLDPERTIMGGYSMGGHATYRIALSHPDLFAEALVMSGPPSCGVSIAADQRYDGDGRCRTEGDTSPLVGNARWLPFVIADGGTSEIVPLPGQQQQVQRFDNAGLRYDWFLYPAEDHVIWPTKDQFDDVIGALGDPVRESAPGRVDLTWWPDLVDPIRGIGTTGAWWVQGLVARTAVPGSLATVHASSEALASRTELPVRTSSTVPSTTPSPYLRQRQTWTPGALAPTRDVVHLDLTNTSAVRVALDEAGLGKRGTVLVTSDGPTQLTLTGLKRGAKVQIGDTMLRADRDGVVSISLAAGSATVSLSP